MKYLLALLLVGCVPTPRTTVLVFPPEVLPMGRLLGTVLCSYNNIPFIVLNPAILGTEVERYVMYHEQIHIRQFAGGCRERIAHLEANPEELREEERMAYCLTRDYVQTQEQTPLSTRYLLASTEGFEERFNTRLICPTQGTAQRVLGIDRGG